MIEQHDVKVTAVMMHWDGTLASAKEIVDHLIGLDVSVASANYHAEMGRWNELDITVYGGEERMSVYLDPQEVATLLLDAEGRPIAFTTQRIPVETIVIGEAPRSIGA